MDLNELLESLESALVAQNWDYAQKIQEVLLMSGDTESLAKMNAILKKAKESQSQPKVQDNTFDNSENVKSPTKAIINLSDPFPMPRLAIRMRDQSEKVENGNPNIYQLTLTKEMEVTDKMLCKYSIGTPNIGSIEKVLMVVGATGAGKTTLINGIVNYILGVQWKDNFRFQLIGDEGGKSQVHSQTKSISAYTIYQMEGSPLPYTLTIIDTPGFGDTEGLKRDKFITEQIREFFSIPNGITHLDGIGFVTQSSLARLTPTQQYIFDAILSIFGKDIARNIFMMVTFADGQKPPVIEAVKTAQVPYSQFFKFNNSALFAENTANDDDENFDEMFWKMGVKSFKTFFTDFEKADSISLQMTKDVLKERKQLEATVNGLLPQITAAQLKLNDFLKEEAVLTRFKDQIEANKNFTWKDTETRQKKIDLNKGEYITNCLTCNCTCHYPCGIPNDGEKYNCAAMRNQGSPNAVCEVCGCSWDKHFNNTYRFDFYQVEVQKTYDYIKQRYEEGIQGKVKVESVINSLNKDLEKVCEEIFHMIQKVQKCLARLEEIALKPNPMTQVQYIDQLIDAEKRQAKFGWEERVKYYQGARDFAITLSKTKDAASLKKEADIKEWAKKLISKLKDDKIQEIDSAFVASSTGKKSTESINSWFENLSRGLFQ